MSAIELKGKIYDQIAPLSEEQDLEDLYETICLFFENRQINISHSPTFLVGIEKRAEEANEGKIVGITTEELKTKMQKWQDKAISDANKGKLVAHEQVMTDQRSWLESKRPTL